MIELTPATRAQAQRVIDDIAIALEHPPPPTDGDPLLATGLYSRDPGFALFYAYLDRVQPRAKWKKLARRYIENAIDCIPEASDRPFFAYGFSGGAWAVQHLSGWFLELPDDALDDIDDGLVSLVETAPTVSFDLQHGLVGFGLYALERLPAPKARRLLEAVVARLGKLAEKRGPGLAWRAVNAEWVEMPDLTPIYRGFFSIDVYNGAAGVVGVLAGAIAAGVATDEARRLLDGALAWLWSTRVRGKFHLPYETGWVMGSLGTAAVCFTAARAAKLESWADIALAHARKIAKTSRAAIREPGLDRGVAGTVHMLHRLHLASGEPVFADAARRYVARLLRRRQPNRGIAGFASYSPVYQRAFLKDARFPVGWIGLPGLLGGVAGIGLVLLSIVHEQVPAWDRALLLSLR